MTDETPPRAAFLARRAFLLAVGAGALLLALAEVVYFSIRAGEAAGDDARVAEELEVEETRAIEQGDVVAALAARRARVALVGNEGESLEVRDLVDRARGDLARLAGRGPWDRPDSPFLLALVRLEGIPEFAPATSPWLPRVDPGWTLVVEPEVPLEPGSWRIAVAGDAFTEQSIERAERIRLPAYGKARFSFTGRASLAYGFEVETPRTGTTLSWRPVPIPLESVGPGFHVEARAVVEGDRIEVSFPGLPEASEEGKRAIEAELAARGARSAIDEEVRARKEAVDRALEKEYERVAAAAREALDAPSALATRWNEARFRTGAGLDSQDYDGFRTAARSFEDWLAKWAVPEGSEALAERYREIATRLASLPALFEKRLLGSKQAVSIRGRAIEVRIDSLDQEGLSLSQPGGSTFTLPWRSAPIREWASRILGKDAEILDQKGWFVRGTAIHPQEDLDGLGLAGRGGRAYESSEVAEQGWFVRNGLAWTREEAFARGWFAGFGKVLTRDEAAGAGYLPVPKEPGGGWLSKLGPWDVDRPTKLSGESAGDLVYTPDGLWLAIGRSGAVDLLSVSQVGQVRRLETGGKVKALAVRKDLLAAGMEDGRILLFRLGGDGGPAPLGDPVDVGARVFSLDFDPDGKHLYVGMNQNRIRRISLEATRPRLDAGYAVPIALSYCEVLAVDPRGRFLASSGPLRGWAAYSLAGSPGKVVAEAPRGAPGRGSEQVKALAFDGAGDRLAAGTDEGYLEVFETKGKEWPMAGPGWRQPGQASLVSDLSVGGEKGTLLAAGLAGGEIRLFDLEHWPDSSSFSAPDRDLVADHVALSPDGTKLAAGGAKGAWVWTRVLELPPEARE